MDGPRFDALARALASGVGRRAVLKGLAGAVLAGVAGGRGFAHRATASGDRAGAGVAPPALQEVDDDCRATCDLACRWGAAGLCGTPAAALCGFVFRSMAAAGLCEFVASQACGDSLTDCDRLCADVCACPVGEVGCAGECHPICATVNRETVCQGERVSSTLCPFGSVCCPFTGCTDPDTDPGNCGDCGVACPSGACCDGACHPLSFREDEAHCGGCGVACAAGQRCCGGACTDPTEDPHHCEACGNRCREGNACCGGACADLQSRVDHCGACDHACAAGERCCLGACADIRSDPQHCGGCGRRCAGAQACVDGGCACAPRECPAGQAQDPESCECVCRVSCPPCEVPNRETCACEPVQCGVCEACDPAVGRCESVCAPGQACVNGGCVAAECLATGGNGVRAYQPASPDCPPIPGRCCGGAGWQLCTPDSGFCGTGPDEIDICCLAEAERCCLVGGRLTCCPFEGERCGPEADDCWQGQVCTGDSRAPFPPGCEDYVHSWGCDLTFSRPMAEICCAGACGPDGRPCRWDGERCVGPDGQPPPPGSQAYTPAER